MLVLGTREGEVPMAGLGLVSMVREGILFVAFVSAQLLLPFRKTRDEVCPRARDTIFQLSRWKEMLTLFV